MLTVYLSYGSSVETLLGNQIDDLTYVLSAVANMAAALASRRLPATIRSNFAANAEKQRSFSLSPISLRSVTESLSN